MTENKNVTCKILWDFEKRLVEGSEEKFDPFWFTKLETWLQPRELFWRRRLWEGGWWGMQQMLCNNCFLAAQWQRDLDHPESRGVARNTTTSNWAELPQGKLNQSQERQPDEAEHAVINRFTNMVMKSDTPHITDTGKSWKGGQLINAKQSLGTTQCCTEKSHLEISLGGLSGILKDGHFPCSCGPCWPAAFILKILFADAWGRSSCRLAVGCWTVGCLQH